jgi:colicin import membrane protein
MIFMPAPIPDIKIRIIFFLFLLSKARFSAIPVPVLESVQQAGGAALAVLWREAQDLAHESLRAAQAGWEVERADAETLNKQMADAYEAQAVELEAAQVEIAHLCCQCQPRC